LKKEQSYTGQIEEIYPQIIKNLIKQYQSKSIKVKVGVMKTLSTLSFILHNKLEEYLDAILGVVEDSIKNEKNNDLITYSLIILKYAFKNTEPTELSMVTQKRSE
jgi:hypothetical protein